VQGLCGDMTPEGSSSRFKRRLDFPGSPQRSCLSVPSCGQIVKLCPSPEPQHAAGSHPRVWGARCHHKAWQSRICANTAL